MTIAKKVEVRDFWYSLQDLVGGVLPESKRVELERLIGQVEEEAKKEIPDDIEPLYMPGGDPRAIRKNPMSGITPKMIGD